MADDREAADGGTDEFELGGDGEIEEVESEVDESEGEDAGGQDDEAEADLDDDEAEEGPQERVARSPARPPKAVRELQRQLRETQDQLRRLSDRPAQPTQPDPQAQARAEAEFNDRLRLMDPVDAIAEVRRVERENIGRYVAGVEGRITDRMDKQQFDAEARNDPARRRLAPEIERHVTQARSQGNYAITRETVFHLLYGQELDKKRREQGPRQRREGQRRVEAQRTRPASGRGQATRERRPAENSAEADDALIQEAVRRGQPLW